jgi:hypothetical protein
MRTYGVMCFRAGELVYKKIKTLTPDEIDSNFQFWNVSKFSDLLKRWNQQIESPITKLKWIYYEQN